MERHVESIAGGDAMAVTGFGPDFVPHEVSVDSSMIRVKFQGGLELATPVSRFPRLEQATPEQRKVWRLIGTGDGIHWPEIDEDISVRGLFFDLRQGTPKMVAEEPAPIGDLYQTTLRLNAALQGRPFTARGPLAATVGRIVAEYVYGLRLEASRAPRIHASTKDGRTVQIRVAGEHGSAFSFRRPGDQHADEADYLVCLEATADGFGEVFSGAFPSGLLREAGDGPVRLSLKRLRGLNRSELPHEQTFASINRWLAPQRPHGAF